MSARFEASPALAPASRCAIVGLGARRPEDAAAIRASASGAASRRWSPTRPRASCRTIIRASPACSRTRCIERRSIDDERSDHRHRPRPRRAAAAAVDVRAADRLLGRWRVADAHVPFAAQLVTDVSERPSEALDADAVRTRRGIGRGAGSSRAISAQRDRTLARPALTRAAGGADRRRPARRASARVTVDAGAHMFRRRCCGRSASRTDADLERPVDDGIRAAGGDRRGARSIASGRSSR